MKKILWIFILLIVIGGFAYVYFNYKPTQKIEYSNVSIATFYNEEMVKTQLNIQNYQINTSNTYELLVLEKGLITIKNINIGNQDFYEKEILYNLTEDNTRIDITLEKPKNPEIDLDYQENKIIINLKDGNIDEAKVCLRSSINYLFLTAENKPRIKKIENYENYHSCYDLETSVTESSPYSFNITYEELTNPTEKDYINMTLIDSAGNSINKRIK